MKRLGLAVDALALLATGGGAALTLAGFAGGWWWLFDLFAHFRLQLGIGLLICALVLSARQRRIAAACAGVAAIANALVVAPLWLDDPGAAAGAERLELTLFNVNVGNRDRAAIADYLARTDSDVIAVLEVDRELVPVLAEALPGYRAVAAPRPDSFGIALLFRIPGDAEVVELYPGALPAIAATLRFAGRDVDLLALHPFPPIGGDGTRRRDRLLAAAADWVEARSRPVVVIGDLNSTPFSRGFRIIRGDRLVSSQRGFGYQATWAPLGVLAVPIDHCLHSRELATVARSTGPALGSDHRPLEIALGWAR